MVRGLFALHSGLHSRHYHDSKRDCHFARSHTSIALPLFISPPFTANESVLGHGQSPTPLYHMFVEAPTGSERS